MDASMTHASSVISSASIRRASAFAALVILVVCGSGCNKLKARDLLNKGVAAYKNAQYDAAIEDFKKFKELLQVDTNNLSAIDGTGSILFQMAGTPFDPKKFEESKAYHQKHIELRPNDPEPYYWIGVIDWTLAYRANGELRAAYNKDNIRKQVKDTDPLPPSVRADYAAKYGPIVDEGIAALQKAIQVRPDYDDA